METKQWFLKAVPNPTQKNISTQIGCHLEEVVEMLQELLANNPYASNNLRRTIDELDELSDRLKNDENAFCIDSTKRIAILDSLADQIVTATGVGTFLGMDVPGALAEVNRSNYSKFENGEPIFNENRKVMKGKDYTPPDLTPFVL